MDTYEGALSDPLTLHKYIYCRDNPISRIDPSGHWDTIQIQAVMAQITVMAARLAPLAAVGSRYADRTLRGVQQVAALAQTLVAEGGALIANEIRIADAAGKVIGRFRADLIVELPNKVTALIESKGVPWYLYGKPGWQTFVAQLLRQTEAFGRAQQTIGVQIQQRIIVFSSKAPEGLEAAQAELDKIVRSDAAKVGYQEVLWGTQKFEAFLETLK